MLEVISEQEDDPSYSVYADLDLERQLLRHIVLKEWSVASGVTSDIFYGDTEREIFEILLPYRTSHTHESFKSLVVNKAGSRRRALFETAVHDILKASALPGRKSAEAVVDQLRTMRSRRSIQESLEPIAEANSEGEVDRAYEIMRNTLRDGTADRVDRGNYLEDFEERLEALRNRNKSGGNLIPTGFLDLDRMSGGLQKGEIGVIVGAVGQGKSIGKLNMAITAWMLGKNVVHIGLEMTREESELRMDTALTQIPAKAFRLANLGEKELSLWKREISRYRKKLSKNYMEFIHIRKPSIQQVFELVENTEERYNGTCDLLILDHITLVTRSGYRGQVMAKHEANFDNFFDLSEWAKKRGSERAVWTSSWATDEGMKRKGGLKLTDLKYGKGPSELGNLVLALYQGESDKPSGDMHFEVIKGRGIKDGLVIDLRPDLNRMVLDMKSFYTLGIGVFEKYKKKATIKK